MIYDWNYKPIKNETTAAETHVNDISPEQRQVLEEAVRDSVIDIFWNRIYYTNTMNGPSVSTSGASEKFDTATREADTSSGKFLRSDKESKFRCLFYFNSIDATDSTTYIGSMGAATTDTGLTSINQDEVSYVALKVVNGVCSIVSKNPKGTSSKEIKTLITDDTTYTLEIDYFPREKIDFTIDGEVVGTIVDRLPPVKDVVTFFPLMVSITRTGSTDRTVTVESWEFIQQK